MVLIAIESAKIVRTILALYSDLFSTKVPEVDVDFIELFFVFENNKTIGVVMIVSVISIDGCLCKFTGGKIPRPRLVGSGVVDFHSYSPFD